MKGIIQRCIRLFAVIICLLLLISVAGFTALPYLLTTKLPDLISQQINANASIAQAELTVSPLRLHLHDIKIHEKNGALLLGFADVSVQINVRESYEQSALIIDALSLQQPFVHVLKRKNGVFNLTTLFNAKTKQDDSDKSTLPVTIKKISLKAGKLTYKDEDTALQETLNTIQLELSDFSTQTTTQAFPLALSLALGAGETLDWQGTVSINPLSSQGRVKLDKLSLEKMLARLHQVDGLQGNAQWQGDYELHITPAESTLAIKKSQLKISDFRYAAQNITLAELTHETDADLHFKNDELSVAIKKSQLKIRDFLYAKKNIALTELHHETDWQLHHKNNDWQFTVTQAKLTAQNMRYTDTAQITAPKLELTAAYQGSYGKDGFQFAVKQGVLYAHDLQVASDGQTLINLPSLFADDVTLDLAKRALHINSVTASDALIEAWLNADGSINYQKLFTTSSNTPMPQTASSSIWTVAINNIVLNQCGLNFTDKTLAKPAVLRLYPIDFKLDNFSTTNTNRLPVQLRVGVNEHGLISARGETVLEPFSATIALAVKNIELEKFHSYLDQVVRLELLDGSLAIDGKLVFAAPTDLKFSGNASISNLLSRDVWLHKDLVKWDKLTLSDMNVDVAEGHYTATTLRLDKPYAKITIRQDKTVNFSDVLIAHKSSANAVQQKTNDTKKPFFHLDRLQLVNGASDFADLSLILPFAAPIKALNGGAKNISSEQKSTIDIALNGNAYELAPVRVAGTVSPYSGDYAVEVHFQGLPMPLMSPYMVQFAGYKVEKGNLTLELNYAVTNKQLTASNNIVVDQFELGETVANPKAVSLPIKLAVALLKDSNGRIAMNVPITGSLEDPQFSIGTLISDALLNSLSKIITSPFSLLGSLIGSEHELSTVSFTSGSSMLDIKQQHKLGHLAQALQKRDELSLNIKGVAYEKQDWRSIREDALYEQLKSLRAEEINRTAEKKIRSQYVELTREDYRRLVIKMFVAQFPLLAEKLPLPKPPYILPEGSPKILIEQTDHFYALAKQKLFELIKPEPERLGELASARAQAIANTIVQSGVSPQRVFILNTAINPEQEKVTELDSLLSLQSD